MSFRVLGVDFDNTLAIYDELFHRLACERGLIEPSCPRVKQDVRDRVRRLENGEAAWQRLQAEAYGPRIQEAEVAASAPQALEAISRRDIRIVIISHKTKNAAAATEANDLHQAAFDWLKVNCFFDSDRLGLDASAVHFCTTRTEKLFRIRDLACDWFVDDLVELLREPTFPKATKKLLYSPHAYPDHEDANIFTSWQAIAEHICGECDGT